MRDTTFIETSVADKLVVSQRGSDSIVESEYRERFKSYLGEARVHPLLLLGDARKVLSLLPDSCIDFAMTSPPYWGKREYESGGIGLEPDYRDFVRHLADVFLELK